jgi:excisionase family DNA binding protein
VDQPPRPITVRIPEACRMTGIGRSKRYELIKAGDIPTIKVGSMTLVSIKGIEGLF